MLCTVAVLAACGQGEQTSPSGSESVASTSALAGAAKKPRAIPRYVETGDLPALRERGKLRLLSPRWEGEELPLRGLPAAEMRETAEAFAERMGLEVQWVLIPKFGDLSGRKVVVHPASSYWESLSGLDAVYGFELVAAL